MKIEIQVADRVGVSVEGKVIKAKVVEVMDGMVFVLVNGVPVAYDRAEVLPLYRYNEDKSQVIPFVLAPSEML